MKKFTSLSQGISYAINDTMRRYPRASSSTNRVLIVTSANGSQRRSVNYLKYLLSSNGVENYLVSTTNYGDHQSKQMKGIEPCIDTVQRGYSLMNRFGSGSFSAVIAIGGPSTMDIAKVLTLMYGKKEDNNISHIAYSQNFDNAKWNIPTMKMNERTIPLISIPTVASLGSDANVVADIVDWKRDVHYKLISNHPADILIHDDDLSSQDNVPFSTNLISWVATLARWCDLELMKNAKSQSLVNANAREIAKGLETLANTGNIPSKDEQKQINKAAFALSEEIGKEWFNQVLKDHLEGVKPSPLPWNSAVCETLSSHLPLSFSDLSASLWLESMEMNYLDGEFHKREQAWKIISSSLTDNESASNSEALTWIKSYVGNSFHQIDSANGKLDNPQIEKEREFLVDYISRTQHVSSDTIKDSLANIIKSAGI